MITLLALKAAAQLFDCAQGGSPSAARRALCYGRVTVPTGILVAVQEMGEQ